MSCIPINDFSLITLCDATKAGKLYSIVPDTGAGDFDVTRASTATYLGSDGLLKTAANNEPRIEFNPDGSYKGLLVEPAATNLMLRSETFSGSDWFLNNASLSSTSEIAPDGDDDSVKIIADTVNTDIHRAGLNISVTNGVVYTFSVFAKAQEYSNIRLRNASQGRGAFFNLATGSVGNLESGTTANILDAGNGWYRCIITYTSNSTSAATHTIGPIEVINQPTFAGDGTSGILIWGAQIETGSYATSYIPTVASTVTRAADAISKTGASALIGQTEGTLYWEVQKDAIVSNTRFQLSDGTSNNWLFVSVEEASRLIRIYAGVLAGTTVDVSSVATLNNNAHKIAFAYAQNDFQVYVDGVAFLSHTSGDIPACSRLDIGSNTPAAAVLAKSNIFAAALLPTRLSNAQLEALTTL